MMSALLCSPVCNGTIALSYRCVARVSMARRWNRYSDEQVSDDQRYVVCLEHCGEVRGRALLCEYWGVVVLLDAGLELGF